MLWWNLFDSAADGQVLWLQIVSTQKSFMPLSHTWTYFFCTHVKFMNFKALPVLYWLSKSDKANCQHFSLFI